MAKKKKVLPFPGGGWQTSSFKPEKDPPIQVSRIGDKVAVRNPTTGKITKMSRG